MMEKMSKDGRCIYRRPLCTITLSLIWKKMRFSSRASVWQMARAREYLLEPERWLNFHWCIAWQHRFRPHVKDPCGCSLCSCNDQASSWAPSHAPVGRLCKYTLFSLILSLTVIVILNAVSSPLRSGHIISLSIIEWFKNSQPPF